MQATSRRISSTGSVTDKASENSVNDDRQPTFQFHLGDILWLVTIIALAFALWRYENEVNADHLGQGGLRLQIVRITWSMIFSTNLCLIVWVRARGTTAHKRARQQWYALTILSLPQLIFFLLILLGMSWGPGSLEMLRGWLALLWCLSVFPLLFLCYGFIVEAASPPHRMLHLASVISALWVVFTACFGW